MDLSKLEKQPKKQVLRGPDLIKLLPLQTKLFDNVSLPDSDLSELSGPFSDVVYNVEVESKRKAKELYGKDLYTAFSFSPEFKAAIEQIKKEMIKENPNYLRTDSMIAEVSNKVTSESQPNKEDGVVKYEFLQFLGIDFEIETKEEEIEDKKKEKEDEKERRKKIWPDEDESMFDTMSGYWRLLSAFDQFRFSPPWYDAYGEGKEHWLSTKRIPPEVLENSRKKCLNWLSKYFDK